MHDQDPVVPCDLRLRRRTAASVSILCGPPNDTYEITVAVDVGTTAGERLSPSPSQSSSSRGPNGLIRLIRPPIVSQRSVFHATGRHTWRHTVTSVYILV